MDRDTKGRRLREEIRWLGELLGQVIREQAGEAAFERVEEVRALARARREEEPGAEERLAARIRELGGPELEPLVTAFSLFFDLANLAEDRQRVRVVRERERAANGAAAESVSAAVQSLRERGLDARRVQELLESTGIEFVFTSHPTEAKRRSVREKIRDLRNHLHELDDSGLLPRERRRLERRIEADLVGLWQTELVRFRRPTVLEELDRSLFFAGNLWRVVPALLRDLEEALASAYPDHPFRIPPLLRFGTWIGGDRDGNPFVTSEVTRGALERLRAEALHRHIQQARLARRNLSMSSLRVGVSPDLLEALEGSVSRWPALGGRLADLSESEPYRRWLRVVQWRLERTAGADLASSPPEGTYGGPGELVADLRLMERSLFHHGGALLADAHLEDWILQARVFGFSLMRLDIRQESEWYHRVVAELLERLGAHPDYGRLSEEERQRALAEAMARGGPVGAAGPPKGGWGANVAGQSESAAGGSGGEPGAGAPSPTEEAELSEDAREAVTLFRLLAAVCRTTGPESLGAQVISMTHRPSDVLAVLWLSRWAALEEGIPDGRLPMPIAPLFETIEDLARADETLGELLDDPVYREHVRALDDRQVVMVGYSDSTKDGGYLSASWNLYEAQARMERAASARGVTLIFFHGRGGALGRGGGPAARHIRSLPAGTLRGGLRITEQGEVLAERYDDPQIARRHLQQMLSAVLECAGRDGRGPEGDRPGAPGETVGAADVPPRNVEGSDVSPRNVEGVDVSPQNIEGPDVSPQNVEGPDVSPRKVEGADVSPQNVERGFTSTTIELRHRDLLQWLADRSRAAYRELVDLPGFIRYFEDATPISQIEELPIGSRPARRRGERSLDTLRAIPWVFSWTQSRDMIPAWYGLGTALDEATGDRAIEAVLRELYRESGFFRATIENAALALAKADMGIAAVHGGLVAEPEVRHAVRERIESEHERSRRAVLELTGRKELLDEVSWLKRSIAVRNPYVDPLNLIQVELVRRLRAAPEGSETRERVRELVRLTIQGIAGGLRTTG